MVEIIPAILTDDPNELREKLSTLEGVVDRVHIDIIDGTFANNKTISPSVMSTIDTSLFIDYHLMTKSPVSWVEGCIRGQADRIIAHIEMMDDLPAQSGQTEFVRKVLETGAKVGLALDLGTSLESLDSAILADVDVILVMGVKAGFGGQKFEPSAIKVIKDLSVMREELKSPFIIATDGGETVETIDDVVNAGAHEVVVGNRLFQGELRQNIRNYQEASKDE